MDRKLSTESSPGSSGFGEDEFSTTTGLRCSPMSSSVSSFELRRDALLEDENGNREIVIENTEDITENRDTSNETQDINGTKGVENGAWEVETGTWGFKTRANKPEMRPETNEIGARETKNASEESDNGTVEIENKTREVTPANRNIVSARRVFNAITDVAHRTKEIGDTSQMFESNSKDVESIRDVVNRSNDIAKGSRDLYRTREVIDEIGDITNKTTGILNATNDVENVRNNVAEVLNRFQVDRNVGNKIKNLNEAKKFENGTRGVVNETRNREEKKENEKIANLPTEIASGDGIKEVNGSSNVCETQEVLKGNSNLTNTSAQKNENIVVRDGNNDVLNKNQNIVKLSKEVDSGNTIKGVNSSSNLHGTQELLKRTCNVINAPGKINKNIVEEKVINKSNEENVTNGVRNISEETSEVFSDVGAVKPDMEVLNKTNVNKTRRVLNGNNIIVYGTSNDFNGIRELSNRNLHTGILPNNSTVQTTIKTQPVDPEEPNIVDINKNLQNEQQTEPVKTVKIKIPEEQDEAHSNWSKALEEITKENLQVEDTAVNGSINGGEPDWDTDSDSDADTDTGRNGKLKIPDGGWGWVVVLASLVLSMIADGISFSFGLIYVELLREFGESKSKTAWIGSLFMAVPLLAGPVASALVDRYGCRKMTIAGGIISAIGFVASSQARSVAMMYATFGVLSGCGLGFCYVTAVVAVAYWFDKRRNLAVGLSACGTGIGTFLYAPLTQYFLDEYGWRGTTLLLAGTFLNMCVCGCLMRDPEWWIAEQNRQSTSSIEGGKSNRNDKSSCGSVSGGDFPGLDEIKKLLDSGRGPEYILTTLAASLQGPKSEEEKANEHASSVVNIPTFINRNEKVPLEVLESLGANKRLYNLIVDNYPSLLSSRSTSDTCLNKVKAMEEVGTRVPLRMSLKVKRAKSPPQSPVLSTTPPPPYIHELTHQHSLPEADASTLPLLNSPVAHVTKTRETSPTRRYVPAFTHPHTHYLKHIRVHRNSVMYRGAMLNTRKYRLRASSCPDIYTNSMTTLAKETEDKWYEDALDTLRGMADFSMLLEFHFLLLCLSTILLFTWFIVPYFYLAEHLNHHGYTELESSRILSLIGVTNTIGMVGLGWAGDQPWMNVVKTYGYCLILCGISSAAIVWFTNNYILLSISCGSFGIFFASNYSFTPVILVQLMPLDKFTTAYGLVLLCQGIGNLLGPPLAGWLFDITGHWDISFNQAGLWIIISGFLMLIIPYTKNKRFFGGELSLKNEDQDSIA